MKRWRLEIMILAWALVLGSLLAVPLMAADSAMEETRYCGEPRRDAAGEIYRRSAVRSAFLRLHPCPATGATTGPCPG